MTIAKSFFFACLVPQFCKIIKGHPGKSAQNQAAILFFIRNQLILATDIVFRWFKFTLKPPYSIVNESFLLAIWDTSHWNFLSNLDSRQLETSLVMSHGYFWNLSTFGNSKAVWVSLLKLCAFRQSKFSQWRSDKCSMKLGGLRWPDH